MRIFFLGVWLLASLGTGDIRSIDWGNLTYPWPEGLRGSNSEETFTLTDGRIPFQRRPGGTLINMPVILASVQYGDLTGDGHEDAVLVMDVITGGSAAPGIVYVYRLYEAEPNLLLDFATGDRTDGGLRSIRIENGNLVVDINTPEGSQGDCCATQYVRTSYRWTPNGFVAESRQTLWVPE